MSGQVLSADAIAALVEAAKEGKLPEEQSSSQKRRSRVRTVDFTRPTKFSADLERRLKRSIDTFCRTAATRLSAELRMPLEMELLSVAQLTWANAHSQVPPKSISAVVDVNPLGTKLLMCAEREIVLNAIDLLLGGSGDETVKDRRFTEIDWVLARHFIDRLLEQLSIIWRDIAEIELDASHLDSHMDTAQMSLVSEPTMALTMEARLVGLSSTLTLLLPYQSIATVANRFGNRDHDSSGSGDPAHEQALHAAVGRVDMTVRAEVAAIDLAIEEVLALKPGDVLPLNAPASSGITLFADQIPLKRAKPGRSGTRRAVQIIGSPDL